MQTTRRSTLALGLGGAVGLGLLGLGATGCDPGDVGDADPAGPAGTGASGGSGGSGGSEPDPDDGLVTTVLADLDARLAAVVAARTSYPVLTVGLQGLEAMHQAHRALLDPDGAAPAAPAPAPGRTARAALRRVRAGEQAHGAALVEASVAARSGALARVLAAMSASVGQHLLVAPTRPGGVS